MYDWMDRQHQLLVLVRLIRSVLRRAQDERVLPLVQGLDSGFSPE